MLLEDGLDSKSIEVLESLTNAKHVFLGPLRTGYVTNDGQLYIKYKGENEYSKVIDNVSKYKPSGYICNEHDTSIQAILTDDNILYEYSNNNLRKIDDNVLEVGDYYYKKGDGKYYIFYDTKIRSIPSAPLKRVEGRTDIALFDVDDVKKIIYVDPTVRIRIYINKDGKLVMLKGEEKEIFNYTIKDMKDMLDFRAKPSDF